MWSEIIAFVVISIILSLLYILLKSPAIKPTLDEQFLNFLKNNPGKYPLGFTSKILEWDSEGKPVKFRNVYPKYSDNRNPINDGVKFEIKDQDKPLDIANGLFWTPTENLGNVIEQDESGFSLVGVINKITCPKNWFWDVESKKCDILPTCQEGDDGYVRGIDYNHSLNEMGLKFNNKSDDDNIYHERIYAICSNNPETNEVETHYGVCNGYSEYNQLSRQLYDEDVKPCVEYDLCKVKKDGFVHKQRIDNIELSPNQYYQCFGGYSVLKECMGGLVYNEVLESCQKENVCTNQPEGSSGFIDDSNYYLCRNGAPFNIYCKYGVLENDGIYKCKNCEDGTTDVSRVKSTHYDFYVSKLTCVNGEFQKIAVDKFDTMNIPSVDMEYNYTSGILPTDPYAHEFMKTDVIPVTKLNIDTNEIEPVNARADNIEPIYMASYTLNVDNYNITDVLTGELLENIVPVDLFNRTVENFKYFNILGECRVNGSIDETIDLEAHLPFLITNTLYEVPDNALIKRIEPRNKHVLSWTFSVPLLHHQPKPIYPRYDKHIHYMTAVPEHDAYDLITFANIYWFIIRVKADALIDNFLDHVTLSTSTDLSYDPPTFHNLNLADYEIEPRDETRPPDGTDLIFHRKSTYRVNGQILAMGGITEYEEDLNSKILPEYLMILKYSLSADSKVFEIIDKHRDATFEKPVVPYLRDIEWKNTQNNERSITNPLYSITDLRQLLNERQ